MNKLFLYATIMAASLTIYRIYTVSTTPHFSNWYPIRIHAGQTIWQFGNMLSQSGNVDPRTVVQAIVDRNHISGNAAIQPGQIIFIPGTAGK